ncbi:MAG TPA: acylphosphatase [Acidimicrobiia bacterium]|jgi:acylphosphatase|nr:acylphosphatase [Acidimicrobiia bacterium]
MPGVVRVRVVVTGRVQGVWFRDSCRTEARALGISGWVRNRGDGAVEAEFEGPEAAVDRMVAWCETGPPRARVDAVAREAIDLLGDAGFRVR